MSWDNPFGLPPTGVKWVSFFAGFLPMLGYTAYFAVGVTALEIKSVFNMNQKQYGLVSTLYMVGSISFVTGPFIDRYGPGVVQILSLVLTVSAHTALWLLAGSSFPHAVYLIYLMYLVAGIGASGMSITTVWVNLANFRHASHGKVLGCLVAVNAIGASSWAIIYQEIFRPNLGSYYLAIALIQGIILVISLFTNKIAPEDNNYEPIEFMDVREDSSRNMDFDTKSDPLQRKGKAERPLWLTLDFTLLLGILGIESAIVHTIAANIATYAESLGFESFATPLLTIMTSTSAVLFLVLGFLSDFLLKVCPRMNLSLILSCMLFFSLVLCTFFVEHVAVLFVLSLATTGPLVGINTLIPAEAHKLFGANNFGKCSGILCTVSGLMLILIQYINSYLYDRELNKQGEKGKVCHGKECIFYGFIFNAALMFVVICLHAIYIIRKRSQASK